MKPFINNINYNIMNTLIQFKIGDPVIYEPNDRNIQMIIKDYKLVPKGVNDLKIVCLITAVRNNSFTVEAPSDKFTIVKGYEYSSVYNQSFDDIQGLTK